MTLKRIRAYAVLIALTIWTVWLVDISNAGVIDRLGKIKGTDFLQFYVSGSLVREGRADLLYDFPTQLARLQALAPGSPDTVYLPIQSPQTALVFAPLTGYGYGLAAAIWLASIVVLYMAACWIVWKQCAALQDYRAETAACAIAFPGLFSTVLHGQTSCVALLAVAIALVALRGGKAFLAGLALGSLVFKPHWVAAAGVIFLAAREWRVLAGLFLAATAQVAITYAALGAPVIRAYWTTLLSLSRVAEFLEPRPSTTLQGLFGAMIPSRDVAFVLYAAAALLTLWLTARLWRSDERFEVRSAAVVLAMILISPHAFEYDLILLAPVYFLLANWIAECPDRRHSRLLSLALAALYVAPLLIGLPAVIRLQFSVTAMSVILFTLSRTRLHTFQPSPA